MLETQDINHARHARYQDMHLHTSSTSISKCLQETEGPPHNPAQPNENCCLRLLGDAMATYDVSILQVVMGHGPNASCTILCFQQNLGGNQPWPWTILCFEQKLCVVFLLLTLKTSTQPTRQDTPVSPVANPRATLRTLAPMGSLPSLRSRSTLGIS